MQTCRCYKRLTTSWFEFRPYVQVSENDIPDGLIPPILSKLAVTCCETCQSHGTSYVDLNLNGLNQSAELPNLRALRKSIANPTDFFFPVYGFKDQTHFAKRFGYQGIVESPGMAYIVNTNSHDDMPNAVLMNISACWPAIVLALAITYLAGLAVWSVVSHRMLSCTKSKLSYMKKLFLTNKQYHVKVLLNSFHLNGHTLGFHPQT
ncbi:hypothetical protein OS493_033022 [Desmophyllum pertusum]|uniref:Uncharacterized protein n=1 Tax=Desmophyllum pertusum TaxID=174260 RepID=A0A9X0D0J6_9CNID|nr:hypothetical protein OS493_033022 [Desmophyllum pertusum]